MGKLGEVLVDIGEVAVGFATGGLTGAVGVYAGQHAERHPPASATGTEGGTPNVPLATGTLPARAMPGVAGTAYAAPGAVVGAAATAAQIIARVSARIMARVQARITARAVAPTAAALPVLRTQDSGTYWDVTGREPGTYWDVEAQEWRRQPSGLQPDPFRIPSAPLAMPLPAPVAGPVSLERTKAGDFF